MTAQLGPRKTMFNKECTRCGVRFSTEHSSDMACQPCIKGEILKVETEILAAQRRRAEAGE